MAGKTPPHEAVIEMGDPRYQIAAIEMEDARSTDLPNGVVIQAEDRQCQSLLDNATALKKSARCRGVAIAMEDPGCRNLMMNR
jgi:hypothetical protein